MGIISVKNFIIPAFVLAFVFCGAIVGETVSISLVVSELGSTVLSKLYFVNGLLLFGLPLLFFKKIDRIDRGNLLSRQLLVISGILVILLFTYTIVSTGDLPFKHIILISLYPLSYLSKTTLFLTFWTLANDIFHTSEAKKTFPIIAAWGLVGGVAGAYAARLLVTVFPTEGIIALWAFSYIMAWFFSEKVRDKYKDQLRFREDLPYVSNHIFADASHVFTMKLVRLMAALYFLIFIAIFSIDYLFWNACHQWFKTSESLASFQFTFYLIHACVTIIGLRLLLPLLIAHMGFARLFYCLPVTLFAGVGILAIMYMGGYGKAFFSVFLAVQFFRYVIFENTFSPIYQLFFTAIEKEKRGRAKTLLEGFVKPGAILSSGLLLMLLKHNNTLILYLILLCSLFTIVIVYFLRRTYTLALIPEVTATVEPRRIIANIASYEGQKLQKLIDDYAESTDTDMRIISVKLLTGIASHQSFESLVRIFNNEKSSRIKEFIAKSMGDFFWYQTRPFMELLLSDSNPRIRANALHSLNRMNCNWKRHLKARVHQLLFDDHMRVQIEAARFLWEESELHEKESILAFLNNLLNSPSPNRKSGGIYLISLIKPRDWEQKTFEHVDSVSIQVFTKSFEVLLRSGSHQSKMQVLSRIEELSREHIAISGRTIEKMGVAMWDTILEFLPRAKNRRMIFEMVRCLRIIADKVRLSGKSFLLKNNTAASIQEWVMSEIEMIYKDGYVRYQLGLINDKYDFSILDQSLRENCIRVCEWAVNAMVLLDKTGLFIWRYTDIDVRENAQRLDLIEILESSSFQKLGTLVLPLLKNESWNIIGKIGKNNFHFSEIISGKDLVFFLKSDNRWVVLCAMYTILYYSEDYYKNEDIVETLTMLTKDPNPHISRAAQDMLSKQTNEEKKHSEAFILLEKVLFFKSTSLFKNVSAEKLMRLAEISQYAIYEKGTVISVQGEVSDHLYIVKKGLLSVIKSDSEVKTTISEIRTGETYGEIGLFTQAPRSASAIANEFCELYIIKRGPFKKILMEVPEIAYNMLEAMSERLRKNGEEIVELKKRYDEDFLMQNSL